MRSSLENTEAQGGNLVKRRRMTIAGTDGIRYSLTGKRIGRPKIDREHTRCHECMAVTTPQWRYLAMEDYYSGVAGGTPTISGEVSSICGGSLKDPTTAHSENEISTADGCLKRDLPGCSSKHILSHVVWPPANATTVEGSRMYDNNLQHYRFYRTNSDAEGTPYGWGVKNPEMLVPVMPRGSRCRQPYARHATRKICLCNACWLRLHKARRKAEHEDTDGVLTRQGRGSSKDLQTEMPAIPPWTVFSGDHCNTGDLCSLHQPGARGPCQRETDMASLGSICARSQGTQRSPSLTGPSTVSTRETQLEIKQLPYVSLGEEWKPTVPGKAGHQSWLQLPIPVSCNTHKPLDMHGEDRYITDAVFQDSTVASRYHSTMKLHLPLPLEEANGATDSTSVSYASPVSCYCLNPLSVSSFSSSSALEGYTTPAASVSCKPGQAVEVLSSGCVDGRLTTTHVPESYHQEKPRDATDALEVLHSTNSISGSPKSLSPALLSSCILPSVVAHPSQLHSTLWEQPPVSVSSEFHDTTSTQDVRRLEGRGIAVAWEHADSGTHAKRLEHSVEDRCASSDTLHNIIEDHEIFVNAVPTAETIVDGRKNTVSSSVSNMSTAACTLGVEYFSKKTGTQEVLPWMDTEARCKWHVWPSPKFNETLKDDITECSQAVLKHMPNTTHCRVQRWPLEAFRTPEAHNGEPGTEALFDGKILSSKVDTCGVAEDSLRKTLKSNQQALPLSEYIEVKGPLQPFFPTMFTEKGWKATAGIAGVPGNYRGNGTAERHRVSDSGASQLETQQDSLVRFYREGPPDLLDYLGDKAGSGEEASFLGASQSSMSSPSAGYANSPSSTCSTTASSLYYPKFGEVPEQELVEGLLAPQPLSKYKTWPTLEPHMIACQEFEKTGTGGSRNSRCSPIGEANWDVSKDQKASLPHPVADEEMLASGQIPETTENLHSITTEDSCSHLPFLAKRKHIHLLLEDVPLTSSSSERGAFCSPPSAMLFASNGQTAGIDVTPFEKLLPLCTSQGPPSLMDAGASQSVMSLEEFPLTVSILEANSSLLAHTMSGGGPDPCNYGQV